MKYIEGLGGKGKSANYLKTGWDSSYGKHYEYLSGKKKHFICHLLKKYENVPEMLFRCSNDFLGYGLKFISKFTVLYWNQPKILIDICSDFFKEK